MKKTLLIMLVAVILSGCYTTLYPPMSMQMQSAEEVPDSVKQVIINNYYETSEYYQIPHYSRYSWLWGDYYWDPFYYDYSYYRWRPHYWGGYYYYYNPYNNYWYYYDHDYTWHGGDTGGSSGNKERIRKPGYTELINSPTGSAPYISVYNQDSGTQRVGKVKLENKTTRTGTVYSPRVEKVGKTSVNSNRTYKSTETKSSGENYKRPSSSSNTKKSSTAVYRPKSSSSSSSSSSKPSKGSHTTSTSSKNNRSQSTSSSSKKSK